jgi:hypothetical protein
MAMLPSMLTEIADALAGRSGEAAWRLGVSVREYREIEAGE